MATQVQWRGGSTAEHSTFTGAAREVTVDTQKKTLVVHDGSTPGGEPLLREDQANLPTSVTNGISVPSANNVAISTNGTGRLFVDASGRVGIGSASPGKNLDIEASDPRLRLSSNTSNNATIELLSNAKTSFIYSQNDGDLNLQANNELIFLSNGGTERLRITSDGKLGLGTSAPTSRLDVAWGGYQSNGFALTLGANLGDSTARTNSVDKFGAISTPHYTNTEEQLGVIYGYSAASLNEVAIGGGITAQNAATRITFFTGATTTTATGTERVRIDSSGKVGIGTTSPSQPLHVASTGTVARFDSSSSDVLLRLSNSSNGLGYIGYQSSNLTFYVNDTERFRCDSSGRLLVGTSSTSADLMVIVQGTAGGAKEGGPLMLARANAPALDGYPIGMLQFAANNHVTSAQIFAARDGGTWTAGSSQPSRLVFSTTADGASSPTERMRIGNNGRLDLFATEPTYGFYLGHSAAAGTTKYLIAAGHSASAINTGTISFAVLTNGNVQNTNNSYGAISDIKLKENIVDASSQWDDLKALQVRNYNFKEGQTHTQIGLIAQEVELVSPGLVSESPDRDEDGNDLGTVTKSVNYSVLYMKAVKALQEAMERIETLEQRLNDAGIA
jgi:hypothetical protein